ncbi:MAG: 3-phosphoshikimate 1-carboxyvinyltransferase [Spirochaetota bacterium]|jgi:3-phosphoshikimate 1-carboxyvinyltransferase|nr:3-phosphoshikimate 1-carboxyvinyltransferase [Spirochaetota bacterium]
MNIKILPGRLGGTVDAIPSKSQAHRALISAALADAPTRVIFGERCTSVGTFPDESGDIAATIACLSALGARIEREPNGYTVYPLQCAYDDAALSCAESGSTFRFMLPIVCALGRRASFILEGRLPQRPLSPLYEELVRHGCELSPQGSTPFHAAGKLISGQYSLHAGVSSQFISGLLFALPLLDGASEIRLIGRAESFPYIELTLAMLEKFGIQIKFDGTVFSVPGGQKFRSPGTARVESDWSNAAFWLAAGAQGEGVTCAGLSMESRQGDRAILDILSGFGARVETSDNAVTVSGGKLRGMTIDAEDIPDLVPILAVTAAAAEGETVIRNAARLRTKESDRLAAIASVLGGLGADICETEDGLCIHGGALTGGEASSWGDHRIAMASAIAASIACGPVVIRGAEAVGKSYPGFFEDMRALGGSIEILP